MPYIDSQKRLEILEGRPPEDAGELNFAITTVIDLYLAAKGRLRYAHLNEAVGVLECAKLELYRRLAAPYEDVKIDEAGDVYTAGRANGG
jgi:hypothetical protein